MSATHKTSEKTVVDEKGDLTTSLGPYATARANATDATESNGVDESVSESAASILSKRWWMLCIVLAALIAAAAVWGAISYSDQRSQQATTNEQAAVKKAAAEGAVRILSYKPQTVDQDLASAKRLLTGDFLDYYTRFTSQVVGPSSKQKQIATSATVPGVGVQSVNGNDAVVLVLVDQQTTSTENPQPAQSASSVRVELTKKDGNWLIEKFDPV